MNSSQNAIVKDLVLIGGGHSHVEVLKNFAMKPVPGVRLTLIARDVLTPYSGMLPGYVAGHYTFDEAHIDLRPLCQFASARLYHNSAIQIDTSSKKVICTGRPPVSYDLLSINIGSRPEVNSVPGAIEFTTPVKPINRFVDKWHQLRDRVLQHPGPHRIAVVGSGAAGVEILLATQFRLQTLLAQQQRQEKLEFHLISKSARIMPTFSARVAKRFDRILAQRGAHVHRSAQATKVVSNGLELNYREILDIDEILWVTGASAPTWLKESGLEVDDRGFITARDSLQLSAHDDIFAAGDIVNVVNHPRPKAGVFAVRQGRPLANNLRRVLLGQSPKAFKPQKTLLALVSSGDKYAIASKAGFSMAGSALWTWKDWIDRQWMRQYRELPEMPLEDISSDSEFADQHSSVRCGGCGAKVAAGVLNRAIADLKPVPRQDILVGLHEPDDAAVVVVPDNKLMVHSVDYFRSFIDDPYRFGQIAANHALSDIFAMGAEAQSALAIATLPYASDSKSENMLSELMSGAMLALNDANAALVGGHSSEGAEMALGFAINGIVDREKILRKGGMQAGDQLILTKPLGTGTLFAADMQHKARGYWIEDALASMIQSNRRAAEILHAHGATACTDVTGFGLLGHLLEMIKASDVEVELQLNAIPLLNGALKTTEMNIFSSLQAANLRSQDAIANIDKAASNPVYPLLFDPQTSGGLLASLPAAKVDSGLERLKQMGYLHACTIGQVTARCNQSEPVRLVIG